MLNDKELVAHAKLLLNVQVADFEDCWHDGYEAANAGGEETHNPYKPHSSEFRFWEDGWWAGLSQEEALLSNAYEQSTSDRAPIAKRPQSQQPPSSQTADTQRTKLYDVACFFALAFCLYEIIGLASA